ncbi:hypothetical protein I3260_08185 [Photobacterium damselae]|uniref:hypothetical protein n=1 Tax=Photobacterium damselae TaxID=38293 RepID=UPI001EDFC96A|nr:hypothetical protein [Photobacterium damselae]MCG3812214.1 hypothetical protein [Photobacterium damselae]
MKIFYLLIFFTWSINVWAARPITYNVTMDYNSVTKQFENARISGGANSRILVNGIYPIEITTAKDSIIGLSYSQAGNGNQQISLRRGYSLFNFQLTNVENNFYRFDVNNILSFSSIALVGLGSLVNQFKEHSFNNGCAAVNSPLYGPLSIQASGVSPCSGDTYQVNMNSDSFSHAIQPADGVMRYYFDFNNNIKKYLNNPSSKIGRYIGTVTYTGDSVFSRVGGAFTESYTFNFTINKVSTLTSINFPNGKISNINVKKINSNFVGNSELNFNVNGVFNFDNKLNFQLTSANTINDKLILKNGNNSIPYNVKLTNITTGKQKLFTQSGQVQSLNISSNDQFQGVLGFSFSVPSSDTPNGNYSDQLTMIVSLDI